MAQQMAVLPESRCTPSRPFSHTGVDYAGPFNMKDSSGRGHRSQKVWIAVFVCFSTRAIHLEVVNAYSTSAFLAAFKCFVSRRGLPSDVYSDRGTTFQGADTELKQKFQLLIQDPDLRNTLVSEGIKWHFVPSTAAHQGGLWESGVRMLKYNLRRVMGAFTPSWDELRTILSQIEACLNSRPLAQLKDDPSDSPALTPGHFLVGSSLNAAPEPSQLDRNPNLLTRWQTTTRIVQSFWNRWQTEYLTHLQRRQKWQDLRENLREGDIVLLRDNNRPPCDWALARVKSTRVGSDGLIRDAILSSKNTELHRPITQLIKLSLS